MSGKVDEKYIRLMKGRIVNNQHIFPKRCLDRFCSESGEIQIYRLHCGKQFQSNSRNPIFCAPKKRTWSQKAEIINGMRIEDSFQEVIENAIQNNFHELNECDSRKVTEFYALWLSRCESIELDFESQSGDFTPSILDRDQKENYERIGLGFVDERGTLSARSMRSHYILGGMMHFLDRHQELKWFMSRSLQVEFVVPDNPGGVLFIPISPDSCFVAGASPPILSADDCRHANAAMIACSKKYYCARDLSRCV